MTSRIATYCFLASLTPAIAAGQPATGSGHERLSLEATIRIAIENNRQLQTARLEVDKAEANVASARTRRLPAFDLEVTASQLLMPVEFGFPRGAFGEFPGTGPIPAVDTTVQVPRPRVRARRRQE